MRRSFRPFRAGSARPFAIVTSIARLGLVWLFLSTAVMHFVRPMPFVRIVPPAFAHPFALVYLSGVAEIVGALALLVPPFRKIAAIELIVVLLAVFPANVNMALHPERFRDVATPVFFWFRLPLQFVYIAWTAWVGELWPAARATESRR